jgi:hypothetical protein
MNYLNTFLHTICIINCILLTIPYFGIAILILEFRSLFVNDL